MNEDNFNCFSLMNKLRADWPWPLWAPVVLLSVKEQALETGSCAAFKVFNDTGEPTTVR